MVNDEVRAIDDDLGFPSVVFIKSFLSNLGLPLESSQLLTGINLRKREELCPMRNPSEIRLPVIPQRHTPRWLEYGFCACLSLVVFILFKILDLGWVELLRVHVGRDFVLFEDGFEPGLGLPHRPRFNLILALNLIFYIGRH